MDSGSAGRGRLRPSPRTRFSERFVELFEAAGNPTLRRVAAASGARMRAARAPGQPGGVPVQRISDWKAGRNVPAKFETLLPVLLTLIDEARKSSRPVRPALLDVREWQRLWTASNEWDPNSDAADVVCPYLGLSAYRAEDAEVFFGRARPTAELAELVRATTESGDGGMVLLVGASGAGKSSLLHAGLIPALADPVQEWAVATMTPGDDPVAALLRAIADSGGNDSGKSALPAEVSREDSGDGPKPALAQENAERAAETRSGEDDPDDESIAATPAEPGSPTEVAEPAAGVDRDPAAVSGDARRSGQERWHRILGYHRSAAAPAARSAGLERHGPFDRAQCGLPPIGTHQRRRRATVAAR